MVTQAKSEPIKLQFRIHSYFTIIVGKPSEKKYERAKVTFTYDPQEDDELKLEV